MTRLGRRASLLVALSLLASDATAYAECAWVLWDGQLSSVLGQDMLWSINGTYSTARDCNDELVRYVVVKEERGDEVSSPRAGIALYKGRDTRGYLECLPDTVDPRGPKGK
jgi:hypothetical protein